MLFIIAMMLIFTGIIIFCYPYVCSYQYKQKVKQEEILFSEAVLQEEKKNELEVLYQTLQKRNEELYQTKQKDFMSQFSYEQAEIDLSQYGLQNDTIGYITIPKMEIELPIILGSNTETLKKGATHLTGTSYPIGGNHTNCVIAAHRGYSKAVFFKYIDKLEYGDKIYIKNFKESLEYEVKEIKLIEADDSKELYIRQNEDLVTLLSCQTVRGNKKRYMVIGERT